MFKAIKLVMEQGLSVSEAATRLSMNQGTLAYWIALSMTAEDIHEDVHQFIGKLVAQKTTLAFHPKTPRDHSKSR